MSYKPTNEDVVAYLYGEMDEATRAQIDQYIAEHPEFKAELEEMEGTRMLMGQLEDEEVPSPMTFMASNTNSEWLYWRKYVAIAASVLMLLTFGKLTGFNLSYGEDGFQAGFGTIQQGLNVDQVNELLQANREQLINYVKENIESVQDDFDGEMKTFQVSFDQKLIQRPETPSISDEAVSKLLDHQKLDFITQMAQLSEKMTDDYRDIFKGLYDGIVKNMEDQRLDDLRDIQAAFTTLEDAALNNQEKVEEALFNLGQEVNTLIAQNNNNNNN